MKKEVLIRSKHGWDIPAIITMPETGKAFPFVVMIHGTASSKDEVAGGYVMMADKLMENGFASIRFDAVGNGDSKEDYIHYTINHDVDDTISCIEYMKTLPEIDASEVCLLGWSQGGTVALITAGRVKDIKSVVTWAGAVKLRSLFSKGYEEAKEKGYTTWAFDYRGPLRASIEWYEEAKSIDTLKEFSPYAGAICACAGTIDDVVPPGDTNLIYNAAQGYKEIVLIENADHIYNLLNGTTDKFEELMDKTIQFYKKTV